MVLAHQRRAGKAIGGIARKGQLMRENGGLEHERQGIRGRDRRIDPSIGIDTDYWVELKWTPKIGQ